MPGNAGAVDTRLEDPQRQRAKSRGEQRDIGEPHDQIWISGHAEPDEPTLEQPAEALT